jgi:hypothetical protein
MEYFQEYPTHNFHDYVNFLYKQSLEKDHKYFLWKLIRVLPIIIWRTLKDAFIEIVFLTIFWLVLVQMSQGRDLVVSIFEPDGLYGRTRIIFTTLAVVSFSVSMWIIPAFLFHQRELRTRNSSKPQNPFKTHLFFMHRILPLVPFWLLARALFNGQVAVFAIAAGAEIVLIILLDWYFSKMPFTKTIRPRRIIIAALGGILILTTIYFFSQFQKQYTSMKVLMAVNLYLISMLVYQVYYLVDSRLLQNHDKPVPEGRTLLRKYRLNSIIYLSYLGLHIVLLLLIYYMPFDLGIAPESMLLYMFSVYVFGLDLFFYFVNVSRRRQLTASLIAMLLILGPTSPFWQINLTHYTLDVNEYDSATILQNRPRDNFADRVKDLRKAIDDNQSGEPYPIILIAGEGGGSRAGLWFSQNLINFDYDTKGKFRNHVFSISTVSGSSVGLGTVFTYWELTRNKDSIDLCWQELPGKVFENNYVGSSVRGLLLTDLYKSLVPPTIKKWKYDRNTILQKEEAEKTAEAVEAINKDKTWAIKADSAMLLRKDLMYFFYEKVGDKVVYRKKTPIAFINTCRSNDGRRGIFSSVRLSETFFNDAIDVAGYLYEDSVCTDLGQRRCYGRKKPISLGQACNTSELFPIFSAPAYIDSLGSFVDGGYHENSGLKTTLEVYQQLVAELEKNRPEKSYKIYILYLKNGSGQKNLYHQVKSSLPLLQPVSALYNQPFEGSASYFEEKARFLTYIDSTVEFIPVTLNPNVIVNADLASLSNDGLKKKLEPEILKDLINDIIYREDGKVDTVLRFPLARWLSKTVSIRIQMCAASKNRTYETEEMLENIRRVYNVSQPLENATKQFEFHPELKQSQTPTLKIQKEHFRKQYYNSNSNKLRATLQKAQ